jgi:hypothetical protein
MICCYETAAVCSNKQLVVLCSSDFHEEKICENRKMKLAIPIQQFVIRYLFSSFRWKRIRFDAMVAEVFSNRHKVAVVAEVKSKRGIKTIFWLTYFAL